MLELTNVSKSFRGTSVLESVNLKLKPGEATGFLGINGAGKTTTMRIIMGVLEQDSGEVSYRGHPSPTETGRPSATCLKKEDSTRKCP